MIEAGGGHDTIINWTNVPTTLFGGTGQDDLHGGTSADLIFGGRRNDDLWGSDGNDILKGGDDDDDLFGQAGADELYGQAGNDSLVGGYDYLGAVKIDDRAVDWVFGGAGTDRFYARENRAGSAYWDVVDWDWREGDELFW